MSGEDGDLDQRNVGGRVDEHKWDEDAVVPAAVIIHRRLQAGFLEDIVDFLCDFRGARGVVFQVIRLGWEAVVVVVEGVFCSAGDCWCSFFPVCRYDSDSAGNF